MLRFTTLSFIGLSLSLAALAETHHQHHHHTHGKDTPFGIMSEHLMGEDEFMLSYRFMRMDMEGNRDGTNRVATPLPGFMVSPLDMTMDMHMLGGMMGVNQNLTLMLMLPLIDVDMNHVVNGGMMAGTEFNTAASGLGDISLTAISRISSGGLLLNAGISFPTGSIDERDDIPALAGAPVQLPYPMQPGSGTWDLLLGLSQTGHTEDFSWGAQGMATLRTGVNDNGYTLGNVVEATAWLSKALSGSVNGSIRLRAINRGDIDGADRTLAATPAVPTKNPELRGGSRIDLFAGLNLSWGRHILAIEIGAPLYQNLHGPQLETDAIVTVGWQASY